MQPPGAERDERTGREAASAMRSDLRTWQRKAVKRMKDRGNAACYFTSTAIPEDVKSDILAHLPTCKTAAEVKALFDVYELEDAPPREIPLDLPMPTERMHETQLRGLEDTLQAKLIENFQRIARQVAETAAA
jgi:hypothetical protein